MNLKAKSAAGVPFDPGDDPLTLEISKKPHFDP
jgi:hypothetical protein